VTLSLIWKQQQRWWWW